MNFFLVWNVLRFYLMKGDSYAQFRGTAPCRRAGADWNWLDLRADFISLSSSAENASTASNPSKKTSATKINSKRSAAIWCDVRVHTAFLDKEVEMFTRNMKLNPTMCKLANHSFYICPYLDIKSDFQSFIPYCLQLNLRFRSNLIQL